MKTHLHNHTQKAVLIWGAEEWGGQKRMVVQHVAPTTPGFPCRVVLFASVTFVCKPEVPGTGKQFFADKRPRIRS